MSKIFISHSSCDNAPALAVARWLEDNHWTDYFLDLSPTRGLAAGVRWQAALRQAAERCEAVIFVISAEWCKSSWCVAEFLLAQQLGKQIFGVVIEALSLDELPRELTSEWQLCDMVSGTQRELIRVRHDPLVLGTDVSFARSGLDQLREGLIRAGLKSSSFKWPPATDPDRSPYPGLRPLDERDAAVFFGRDADLLRAMDVLRVLRETGSARVLVVLGASGAGKSSFLRAGLAPRLSREDRQFLPLPVIRARRSVLEGAEGLLASLDLAFRRLGIVRNQRELREQLQHPAGFTRMLDELGARARERLLGDGPPPTVVLLIDQGEELFGPEGGDDAQRFRDDLMAALSLDGESNARTSQRPRAIAIVALRADSYPRLQNEPLMSPERVRLYPLNPVAHGEFKTIIEGPARRATESGRELIIDPKLTARLLEDTRGPDALPLLAFTLERLFVECGADGDLKLEEYEGLGGVAGAIEAAIEKAFDEPDREPTIPGERCDRDDLLQQALPWLALVDPDTGERKRRIATLAEIPNAARAVLERLVNAHLLVKDRSSFLAAEAGQAVLELAHEALLRQWPAIDRWLAAEGEALQRLESARRAGNDWMRNAKHDAWLVHRGDRLARLALLQQRPEFSSILKPEGLDYFEACKTAERQSQARERGQRQREDEQRASEARSRRRLRWLTAGLAVALAVAIFATLDARKKRWEAERATEAQREAKEAERVARVEEASAKTRALARQSAAEAQLIFDRSPTLSLSLATFAASLLPDEPATRQALYDAVGRTAGRLLYRHKAPVKRLAMSGDMRWVSSGAEDSAVRLIAVDAHPAQSSEIAIASDAALKQVAFSSSPTVLMVNTTQDVSIWSLPQEGSSASALLLWREAASAAALATTEAATFAIGTARGTVEVWRVDSVLGAVKLSEFSPGDGRVVAIEWARERNELWTASEPSNGAARIQLWQLDDQLAASALASYEHSWNYALTGNEALLADPDYGPQSLLVRRDVSEIRDIRWVVSDVRQVAANHDLVFLGMLDNSIEVRTPQTLEQGAAQHVLRGHSSGTVATGISRLVASKTGRWLASTGQDAGLLLWSLTAADAPRPIRLVEHDLANESGISALEFGAQDGALLTGGTDGSVRLVSLDEQRPHYAIPVRTTYAEPPPAGTSSGVRHIATDSGGQWFAIRDRKGGTCITPLREPLTLAPSNCWPAPRLSALMDWSSLFAVGELSRFVSLKVRVSAVLWDVAANPTRRTELEGWDEHVRVAATSADNRWLVAMADAGRVLRWDLARSQHPEHSERLGAVAGADAVAAMAITGQGDTLYTLDKSGELRAWQLTAGELKSTGGVTLPTAPPPAREPYHPAYFMLLDAADDVLVILNGSRLYASRVHGGQLDGLELLEDDRGHAYLQENAPDESVHIGIDRHGHWLVAGNSRGEVYGWDMRNGRIVKKGQKLGQLADSITALAFSRDGQQLAAGSYARDVLTWSFRSGVPGPPLTLRDTDGWNFAAAFVPRGLFVGTRDGLAFWPLDTGRILSLARDLNGACETCGGSLSE